ncbi:peroxisomal membrane protein pex14 [Tieghemiomyces parasiticus]|uniref:Peroxisomal membrane protein PEX14 n=1 Tax=Tieghemiomyces parasiticus TaxID=78921 RepID=A0A9W8DYW9_9FUNG|nr:peroxisomal membrane protein pex14 [Tieghemiomyces parasiticus]
MSSDANNQGTVTPPTPDASVPAGPAPATLPPPAPVPQSSAALRPDLIQSAVRFLADPKVQSASLDKRKAFLTSKGLTPEEITAAVAQAGLGGADTASGTMATTTAPVYTSYPPPATGAAPYGYPAHGAMYPQAPPPPVPQMHWKDYFIAAVVASGVGYGLYGITTKYLVPYIQKRAFADLQTELDDERTTLQKELTETREALTTLQKQSQDTVQLVSDQTAKLQTSVETMTKVLEQWQERESQRSRDVDTIRSEFESITKLLPEAVERNKDTQSRAFQDLQGELKSLKSLFLSRRGPQNGTASPAPASSPNPQQGGTSGSYYEATSPVNGSDAGHASYAAKAAAFAARSAGGASPSSAGGLPAWQMVQPSPKPSSEPTGEYTSPQTDASPRTNDDAASKAS